MLVGGAGLKAVLKLLQEGIATETATNICCMAGYGSSLWLSQGVVWMLASGYHSNWGCELGLRCDRFLGLKGDDFESKYSNLKVFVWGWIQSTRSCGLVRFGYTQGNGADWVNIYICLRRIRDCLVLVSKGEHWLHH